MVLAYGLMDQSGVARMCPQGALPVPPRPCIRSHPVPQAVPCTHPQYPTAPTTLPFPPRSKRVNPQPQHKSLLAHKRPKTPDRASLRTRETPFALLRIILRERDHPREFLQTHHLPSRPRSSQTVLVRPSYSRPRSAVHSRTPRLTCSPARSPSSARSSSGAGPEARTHRRI